MRPVTKHRKERANSRVMEWLATKHIYLEGH